MVRSDSDRSRRAAGKRGVEMLLPHFSLQLCELSHCLIRIRVENAIVPIHICCLPTDSWYLAHTSSQCIYNCLHKHSAKIFADFPEWNLFQLINGALLTNWKHDVFFVHNASQILMRDAKTSSAGNIRAWLIYGIADCGMGEVWFLGIEGNRGG